MAQKIKLPKDRFVELLDKIIKFNVRALSVLMVLVIGWGVADVVMVLVTKLMEPPIFLLTVSDLFAVFGAFMVVLLAIEIFINIVIYLKEEVIQVRIILATAIVAVARKIIVFDYQSLEPEYVWATGMLLIALCVGYWLTGLRSKRTKIEAVSESNEKIND